MQAKCLCRSAKKTESAPIWRHVSSTKDSPNTIMIYFCTIMDCTSRNCLKKYDAMQPKHLNRQNPKITRSTIQEAKEKQRTEYMITHSISLKIPTACLISAPT